MTTRGPIGVSIAGTGIGEMMETGTKTVGIDESPAVGGIAREEERIRIEGTEAPGRCATITRTALVKVRTSPYGVAIRSFGSSAPTENRHGFVWTRP